jgi:hypothetical protein
MGRHRLNKYYNYRNEYIIYIFKWKCKGRYFCKVVKIYGSEIDIWEGVTHIYFEDWADRLVKELTKDEVMVELL